MKKSELRKIYLEKRKALSKEDLTSRSKEILNNFMNFFQPAKSEIIHIFLTMEKFYEIETDLFIEEFWKRDSRVFVPKIVADKMESVEITSKTLFQKGKWDILEPVAQSTQSRDFDYIIIPLLYADNFGNRVGYGKGFYDEFLANINPLAKIIGINFFSPREEITDIWENDIPVHYLVTPTEVLSF